jgi:hypothetical protein
MKIKFCNRKGLLILFSVLNPIYIVAQEPGSKFSMEFGISANRFEYGEKGVAISNGLVYQLSPIFKLSPSFSFAYGFYRYSENQIEPSFVEARYLSFHLPIQLTAPGRFDFLSIGFGPCLTYRSRVENTNFKNDTTLGTTRLYNYDNGIMSNTLYAGIVGQIEARIYKINRISFHLFIYSTAYFNPFKIDYYGGGIKTYVNL